MTLKKKKKKFQFTLHLEMSTISGMIMSLIIITFLHFGVWENFMQNKSGTMLEGGILSCLNV